MKLCWFYIGEQLTKDIERHWRKNKINMKSRLNASCLCKFSKPCATDMWGPMCFYLLHSLFTTKVCLVPWQGIQYTSEKRYHWCAGNCIGCKSSVGSNRPQCIVFRSLWNLYWQVFDGSAVESCTNKQMNPSKAGAFFLRFGLFHTSWSAHNANVDLRLRLLRKEIFVQVEALQNSCHLPSHSETKLRHGKTTTHTTASSLTRLEFSRSDMMQGFPFKRCKKLTFAPIRILSLEFVQIVPWTFVTKKVQQKFCPNDFIW